MAQKETYYTNLQVDVTTKTSQFEKFKKSTDKWINNLNLDNTIKKQLRDVTLQTKKWELEFQNILDLREKLNNVLKNNNLSDKARVKVNEQLVEANRELVDLFEKQKEAGVLSDSEINEGEKVIKKDEKPVEKEDSFLSEFIKGDEGSFGKSLKAAALDTFGPKSSLAETVIGGFKNILDSIVSFVTDIIKKAFEKMEDMASFNLGLTNKYNEDAISYFENWGLTGANAYAMQQALESVGMDDVEDLFMAQGYGMTEVLEEFKKQFEYFKNEYETTDEEMILTYQQFQKDWNDFKQHFQQEIINFFSNNKELLTDTLNTLIDILPSLLEVTKGILNAVGRLLPHSVGETTQQAADIYESIGAVSNNSQIVDSHAVTNYTFNGITQSQLNEIKSSINKGNIEYYNSKAVR